MKKEAIHSFLSTKVRQNVQCSSDDFFPLSSNLNTTQINTMPVVLKVCSYDAIVTAIFVVAANGLYGIQSECSYSVIATTILNPI